MSEDTEHPDHVGRRERKKRQTTDDLIAAAMKLFEERGFDETTTAAIAEAADVSQRTFFRHFASKEAVLYGDAADIEVAFRDAILRRPLDEPPLEAVASALRTLTDSYAVAPERTFLQARLAAASPAVSAYSRAVVQRGLERVIVAALAERLGVDPVEDPRPEVIAGAAMSALRVALRRWAGSGDLEAFAAGAASALRSLSGEMR